MKKASILISLIVIVLTGNAQTSKIEGSWLMVKAEIAGEIEEPLFITDFNKNGKMEIMDMEIGSWKYNKKKNSIDMESPYDEEFYRRRLF